MTRSIFQPVLILLCAMTLASCAKNMSSDVYSEGATAGKVLEGKVISTRNVTIKAHDKLQDNTAGGLAGGVAGGLGGAAIGNGSGSVAAAVGGAILGAVGGAMIQDAIGTSDGVEYLVKIDKKFLQEYHTISKKVMVSSKQGIEQDMTTNANIGTKSDIVSVVQAPDAKLHVGSPVYIIYNDDRPRLTAKE